MLRTVLKSVAAVALVLTSTLSFAVPIKGAILFSSFDWSKDGTTVSVVGPSIVAATGDLAGQTGVVFNDFDYSPFSALDPLWETDDFSFALNSLVVITETATGLEIEGNGVISDKNGILDDTSGTWSFSGGTINWSSATVPEPASIALLGLGLAGLGATRHKKNT